MSNTDPWPFNSHYFTLKVHESPGKQNIIRALSFTKDHSENKIISQFEIFKNVIKPGMQPPKNKRTTEMTKGQNVSH